MPQCVAACLPGPTQIREHSFLENPRTAAKYKVRAPHTDWPTAWFMMYYMSVLYLILMWSTP
jgi:hypothetical protein